MTSGGNFEGLPDIIKKLTESPEIADIIKNAGLQQKEEPKEEPRAETANEPFNLSPEMMAKLPSVISMLQGMGITGEQSRQSSEQKISESAPSVDMNELAAKLPQAMSALSSMGIGSGVHKAHREDKKREALLKAIRPYMSERKRVAIDTMLGFGSLAEIMMMFLGGER